MVLDDVFSPEKQNIKPGKANAPEAFSETPWRGRMASPLDRLAAVIADLVIFVPMATVCIAPFKRQSIIAQLTGSEADWISAAIFAGSAAVVSFLAFQTICLMIWGATPGKIFLGLKVITLWEEKKPRPMQSFLRSFVWILEALAFGLPFLSVFSNDRRRPWHDRISDTYVIHREPKRAVAPPDHHEITLVSAIHAAVMALLTVVAMASLNELSKSHSTTALDIQELEAKNMLCPMVGEVSDEGADGEQPERLKIAMSLYAADVIEEDCLDTEADFALWHRQDKHNAYLAKALAHSADEKMFQNYSQKTCEENEKSDECRLLDLLASQGHREGESSLLKSQELKASNFLMAQVNLNSPEYLQIWLIKYFAKQREFNKVLQLLENVPPQKGLSQFFANQRTKALWSLDRINEARVASRMTIESASPSQRIEIASWVCQRELRDGCTVSVAQSCHELQAAVATNNELLKTPEVALSFINEELCRSSGMVSSDVKEKLSDPRALQFVSGLEEAGKKTAKPKLEEFKKMSAKGAETDAFFYESQRILVDAAESVKDVQSLLDYWLKDTPSDDWVTVGLHLNARLTAWGGYEKALAVAQKLQAFEVSSPSMSRLLVVSAFHAGQTELAAKTLSALPQDRAPASVDEFEKIATRLREATGP